MWISGRTSPKQFRLPLLLRRELFTAVVSTLPTAKSWVSSLRVFLRLARRYLRSLFYTATQQDVDGFLVGGASLKSEFIEIINCTGICK
jgi:Triosephosphate isomerase